MVAIYWRFPDATIDDFVGFLRLDVRSEAGESPIFDADIQQIYRCAVRSDYAQVLDDRIQRATHCRLSKVGSAVVTLAQGKHFRRSDQRIDFRKVDHSVAKTFRRARCPEVGKVFAGGM